MVETLLSIFKYVKIKLFLAILPASILVWTNDHQKIIVIMFWILVLDTILGMITAFKHKTFSSFRMAKMTNKFVLYGLAMGTAYLVSILLASLSWVFYGIGSYIVMNEAFSNFEKLALLGFRLPTKMLAKISNDYYHIYQNNGKSREALDRLLYKDRCSKK